MNPLEQLSYLRAMSLAVSAGMPAHEAYQAIAELADSACKSVWVKIAKESEENKTVLPSTIKEIFDDRVLRILQMGQFVAHWAAESRNKLNKTGTGGFHDAILSAIDYLSDAR